VHRVRRPEISKNASNYLEKKQKIVKVRMKANNLDMDSLWKSSRQTKAMKEVLASLKSMMPGKRERCMYCVDSHGADIEHFRPKASYPRWAFRWANFLLCCSECGRIKGENFPVQRNNILLINPSLEEPWDHLDFDPRTGNITSRYIVATGLTSPKGDATVKTLEFDKREAMAESYKRTYSRLEVVFTDYLAAPYETKCFIADLKKQDDHGLIGWFFKGAGQGQTFCEDLKLKFPLVWGKCLFEFRHF
jgi:uncharacterized protein (TIGR02646 family)